MDDDRAARRILQHVKQQGGHITALRLAEIENLALALATEQLLVSNNSHSTRNHSIYNNKTNTHIHFLIKITEQKGLICRDEGPTGLTYYENLFLLL